MNVHASSIPTFDGPQFSKGQGEPGIGLCDKDPGHDRSSWKGNADTCGSLLGPALARVGATIDIMMIYMKSISLLTFSHVDASKRVD
jgi:hypothetical protein